ncbi:hypothetical protein GCM10023068_21490 [Leifsonia shinshuensis]
MRWPLAADRRSRPLRCCALAAKRALAGLLPTSVVAWTVNAFPAPIVVRDPVLYRARARAFR